MTDSSLAITVYYDDESPALLSLIRELDELGVAYDESAANEIPADVRSNLRTKAGGNLLFPAVLINNNLLVRPTAANVMSAIMHERSGGFYQ